jgi:hypothetical protein
MSIRSCFKIPQPAQYGIKKLAQNAHLLHVNFAFSPIIALSCTRLSNFKTASQQRNGLLESTSFPLYPAESSVGVGLRKTV